MSTSSVICKSWRKLQEYDTLYSADSIEFCPVAPWQHIILCGTYQLTEGGENTRKGSIILFELDVETQSLNLVETMETDAILDMKWCHCRIDNQIVLGVVNAKGQLIIYNLIAFEESSKVELKKVCSYQLMDETETEILALSLDWSSRILSNQTKCISADNIVISDSQGGVVLFTFNNNALELVHTWKCHQFECWISAFDYSNSSVIYSGGDDSKLRVYDARQKSVILTNSQHEAGVTSIQCNPFRENDLATGSYDECLYSWDTRQMKTFKTKIKLDGGVWRIKHQSDTNILTATMYNGFHFVNTANRSFLNYNEHGNIAYGIDSCYSHKQYVVTCSFYNHLLNLSSLEDNL